MMNDDIKLEEKIKELQNQNKILQAENEQLKLIFGTCSACKHADLYIPAYIYPFFDPKCAITGESIDPKQNACRDFELFGRNGR